ncbi:MAG TPA: xanthine dehydrogenase family protein molybdopterin-binding subunit [Vicinamibacterales bacterium]|nr:xanthine dehydrogenase family protein molybdopterin-binding subunit [Vicinamibacterales bacterium]
MAKAQEGRGAPPPAPAGPSANARKYAWPAKPAVLSTRVKRLDGPDKVTGRAKYSFDINRPGMIYGKIVRSPYPHAKIVSVDLSAAKAAPGVRATLVWKDQPTAQALYQGDPVAAVAADTEEQAEDAARLVKVTYDVLEHVANVEQAMAGDAPKIFDSVVMNTVGNQRKGNVEQNGDIEAGFKAAAHIVEQTYSTHVITHVCMETHGCVCEWDGDKLTAWVTTQGVHGTKDGFAQGLKIPGANVRVITQYMGGGFGSKFGPDAQGLICARLAKEAGRPVKLFLDRKEEHLDTGNRPSAYAKIRAGVSADGKLTAFDATSWGTGGAGATSNFPLPYIYNFPNRRRAHIDVFINAGQQRAMRAPGHPQGCFLTEILMDELADRVRMDPVQFRIQNLPTAAASRKWGDYFAQAAKAFGWEKRHATGDPRPGPIKNGFGCSAHQWGGGGRGGRAHVDITSDGSVVMKVGTQDLGTGTRTLVAMLTAETFGLPVGAVTPEIGDTNYPVCGASGGSTTAASISPAIRIASGIARDQLFAKVAPQLGTTADNLVAENGRINVKGSSKGMAWKEACRLLGAEPISVDGQWEDGLSSTGTSGVQFTEVDVDIETGIVKVKRILTMQDCGLIVSRLTAESQVYGGIVGSLNFALFEDRILDRVTGQMVNPNMESYLLAGLSDIPKIDVMLVDTPEQRDRGVIGIGEPPTVSTASAIANAIRNATGATVRSLPLHPHRILQAIEEQKAGGTL